MKRFSFAVAFLILLFSAHAAAQTPWVVETIAGGGPAGPAIDAALDYPTRVVAGPAGEIYAIHVRERQLVAIDSGGQIRVVATTAAYNPIDPNFESDIDDLAVGADGMLYVSLSLGPVTRLDPTTSVVEILFQPLSNFTPIAVDRQNRVYSGSTFSFGPHFVSRYDPADGSSTTVLGCETIFSCPFFTSDGQLANSVVVGTITAMIVDDSDNLYVSTWSRVYRINAATGTVSVYAGLDTEGFSGDGGPAAMAELDNITDLALDAGANLLIADRGNQRIRRVDASTRIISTIAGSGTLGYSGDGGPATAADLSRPGGVTVTASGDVIVADSSNYRVRSIDTATGIIDTIGGTGQQNYDGRETLATNVAFTAYAAALDADGSLVVATGRQIHRIDPSTGLIRAIAGSGEYPLGWVDGADALAADIAPGSLAFGPAGDLFFTSQNRIHRIDRTTNQVFRLPNGIAQFIAFSSDGSLFAADLSIGVLRYDFATQQMELVAGGGNQNVVNGIDAMDADLDNYIRGLTIGPNDDLFISYIRLILRKPQGGTILSYYAGGAGPGSTNTDGAVGPISAGAIPAALDLDVEFDETGNGFTSGHFLDEIYRIDHLTGDAVRILGSPRIPPDPVDFQLFPFWILPIDSTHLYIGSVRKIFLATNTNQPPVALADIPVSVACDGPLGVVAQLDATASTDPDDLPTEPSEVSLHWWYEDYGLATETLLAKGEIVDVSLPLGNHEITLLVRDFWGGIGTDTVVVNVHGAGDSDEDGVDSCLDNCPTTVNPTQEDTDQNGVGDLCDPCSGNPSGDVDTDGICTDIDNCPLVPNPSQIDTDSDGFGDDCDVCPIVRTETQEAMGSCVLVPEVEDACIPVAVDSENASATGQVVLSVLNGVAPTWLRLELFLSSCSDTDRWQLFVNNELVIDEPSQAYFGCTSCLPLNTSFTLNQSPELAAAWIPGRINEIRFVKTGTDTDIWRVRYTLQAGSDFIIDDIFTDPASGSCIDGVTDVERSVATELQDIFSFESDFMIYDYGPGSPAFQIDAADLGTGEYRLCVSSTDNDDSGQIVGVTGRGQLVQIDRSTGAGTLVGVLPIVPEAFVFEPMSGKAFVSQARMLREIDLVDGTAKGQPVALFGQIYAMASRKGTLIGATHSHSNFGASRATLSFIQPDGGFGGHFGEQDPGWIHDLSYDPSTDRVFGISGSEYGWGGVTVKFPPYLAPAGVGLKVDTITPFSAGTSITVGPDNVLYRAGGNSDSSLYRLGPNGYDVVGDIGFDDFRSLTTIGSKGHRDCTQFRLEDGQSLSINQSCGAPTAAIVPPPDGECDSAKGDVVVLDGSGSTDPNDPDDILANALTFAWYEDYGTLAQTLIGTDEIVDAFFPVGSHAITLEVTNRFGETALASVTVEIGDVVPPVLELSLNPTELWPPNHRMVDVKATVIASDNCSVPTIALASLTSNEADDALDRGDGKTTGDIQPGSDDFHFSLRAERAGSGGGRIYTVVYTATDSAGNVASEAGFVVVPHDQGSVTDPVAITLEQSASGTVVSWPAVSEAESYDVIRGELSSVVETGAVIRLGRVVCIEANSTDESTAGQEDSDLPNPGKAFFYLVEYDDGISSSYGTESAGKPRAPDLGDCQ